MGPFLAGLLTHCLTMSAEDDPTGPNRNVAKRRFLLGGTDPYAVIGMFALIGVWWALTLVVPRSSIPSPLSVAHRIAIDFFAAPDLVAYGLPAGASFLTSVVYTTENVFVAVLIGGFTGTILGLCAARLALVRAILDPIAVTVGAIPILVAAPFFLIWFGVGRISAMALVIFYVVVTLYIFAQRTAENLDPVYEESARTLGAKDWRVIRDILVPGTMPQILGGLRIALAGAWGLEAISELLGSERGMGKIISMLGFTNDVEGIFATLILLGIVAVAADGLLRFAIARLTAWSVTARTSIGNS